MPRHFKSCPLPSVRLLLCLSTLLLALCLAAAPAHALKNPFVSSPDRQTDTGVKATDSKQPESAKPGQEEGAGQDRGSEQGTLKRKTPVSGPSWSTAVLNRLSRLQFVIRGRMVELAQDIHQKPLGAGFWLFMALALAYGIFHAVGPGHGKLLTISYFLNRPGRLRTCLLFGYVTMLVHVLSATGLVFGGYYLLRASAYATVDTVGPRLEAVSYGLIMLLGAGMTLKVLWNLFSQRHGHAHACPDPGQTPGGLRTLLTMSVAAGLVPCPGATIVLVFAVSQGLLFAGLGAMVAISLGMGLTISLCGMLAVVSRGALLRLLQGRQHAYTIIHALLALTGSLCITLFGAAMYLAL